VQHTKYDELKNLIGDLSEKLMANTRMMKSTLTLMKDFDHRIDAMKQVLVASGATTAEAYDEICDELRGLRLKGDAEPIELGDIVWVSYEAKIADNIVAKEDALPIRVGSGTINFESALIGHFSGEKAIKFDFVLPDGPQKDKEVNFLIGITRVKTMIKKEEEIVDEFDQPAGSGDAGTGNADPQPSDQGDGSGNQERGDSKLTVVPSEPSNNSVPSQPSDQPSVASDGSAQSN